MLKSGVRLEHGSLNDKSVFAQQKDAVFVSSLEGPATRSAFASRSQFASWLCCASTFQWGWPHREREHECKYGRFGKRKKKFRCACVNENRSVWPDPEYFSSSTAFSSLIAKCFAKFKFLPGNNKEMDKWTLAHESKMPTSQKQSCSFLHRFVAWLAGGHKRQGFVFKCSKFVTETGNFTHNLNQ